MARSLIASDNFSTAPTSSGNWQQMRSYNGTVTGNGSVAYGSDTQVMNQAPCARWIGAGSFSQHQYSSIVIGGLAFQATNYGIGVLVRAAGGDDSQSGDATRDYYGAFVHYSSDGPNYSTSFFKVVNAALTTFHTADVAWSNGDRIEIEAENSTIRVLKNGTELGGSFTTTDGDLTSGAPGIIAGGASASYYGDNWEAGDLVTSTTGTQLITPRGGILIFGGITG